MKFLVLALLAVVAASTFACSSGGGEPKGQGTTASVSPNASGSPGRSPGILKAVTPQNPADFQKSFGTVLKNTQDCKYDQKTAIVDCTNVGLQKVQIDPAAQGLGVKCHALLNGNTMVGIVCASNATPNLFGAIYQIQR